MRVRGDDAGVGRMRREGAFVKVTFEKTARRVAMTAAIAAAIA